MFTKHKTSNATKNDSLKKELGLFSVFSISAGAMISSGLFILPGLAYAQAGPACIISYAIASLFILPVLFSQAELSTAMPKAGGSYFFIERSLGPLMGTIAGFANWLSIAFKATFALAGIGILGALFFPENSELAFKIISLFACFFFTLFNILSTKESGRLQNILVFFLLGIIIFYVLKGFPFIIEQRYLPFVTSGWQSVFAVAGMVFISYGGLTKVVSIAEEVESPSKNLPMGMLLSFGVVSILYILVIFITIGLVEGTDLSGSLVPISLGAKSMMGQTGVIIVEIAAFLAFATTANSGILAASRAPMAMSRDGLLPGFFSKTSKRFGTPIVSICFTSLFMVCLLEFLSIEDLVKTASTMIILMFMLVNLSIIIMRESNIQNYRPTFKSPLYPWIQIAAIIIYGFLIFEMGHLPLFLTAGFIMIAVFWYLGYVLVRIDRQSALVYLVKRIMSKNIGRSKLDEELVQIVLERDEVAFDRFDHLINDCLTINIEESIKAKDLFKQMADELSPRLGIESDKLFSLFLERERESSTIIKPGLAIPHVIVPGEKIFDIVLVRSKKGIIFSELQPPVRTAFVLVGSSDERNYHLRALMTIAHIVQEKNFEELWMAAKDIQHLKDVILLSGRTREKTNL